MMMFKDAQEFMPGESPSKRHYRAIFISDLHLGTPGCQAEALLEFLKTHTCDTLYLVGDIIDGWQLRRKWYWPQAHNDVVQKLLRKARKGCRVVYVPGNHDEFARDFLDHSFGGVEVVEHAVLPLNFACPNIIRRGPAGIEGVSDAMTPGAGAVAA